MSQLAKNAEHNQRVREKMRKRGGLKQSKDPKDPDARGAGL